MLFAAEFTRNDYQNKFIVNYISLKSRKHMFAIAGCVMLAAYSGIILFAAVAGFFISSIVFQTDYLVWKDAGQFALLLVTSWLLLTAAGMVIMFLTNLSRNMLAGMLGLVYFFMYSQGIYVGIDYLEAKLGIRHLSIKKYMLVGNIIDLNMTNTTKDFIRGVIVALTFCILAGIGYTFVLQKRDILK